MEHQKYKELIELNVWGELSEVEQIELENHLFECTECNEEYAKLKKMCSVISTEMPTLPSDQELLNARKRLFNILSLETEKLNLPSKPDSVFDKIFTIKFRFALGGVALILVGFVSGYLLFNNFNGSPKFISNSSIDLDKLEREEIKISNITLPERFSENGNFEFKLADNKLNNYTGKLDDVIVQKLLAVALNETENSGFKIRAANSIARQTGTNFNLDPQIKKALISSLNNDTNPAVRKSALKALVNFPFQEDVRDALLHTLENDPNASNRMDAINALLTMNLGYYSIDDNIKSKLEQGILNEENEVVKIRTEKLIIGGK